MATRSGSDSASCRVGIYREKRPKMLQIDDVTGRRLAELSPSP
jgi:hypothetical protein